MSQCYLGSESKNSMTKFYFEVFIANYFYTFNKKDPVEDVYIQYVDASASLLYKQLGWSF